MKISLLNGHLTATNKKVVKYMIENNLNQAGSGGIGYYLIKENENYKVTIVYNEWDCSFMRNKKVLRKYISTFKTL